MSRKRNHPLDLLAFVAAFFFTLIGNTVSLHRFWQYEVSFVDFGLFDQAIWKVSRFQEPTVYHFIHGKINVLGDHAMPSIFLLSPFYWFTDKSEMLLVVQAIAVGLSGLFLYDIAKHILKRRDLSFSILLCYFLFVGLQNAVITEFHELTVMTLPLMLTFWAMVKNKTTLYFVFLIITLGFKEITFALGIAIGIFIFLYFKNRKKQGILTIIISVLWALFAFKIIIPYFAPGGYLYLSDLPPTMAEKITALFDHPLKRRTLFYSFTSFSFLPFFAPEMWLAILQDYASRFIPQHFITRADLGLHYNAQSAVILAISSVIGLKHLLRFSFINRYSTLLGILLIVNAFVLFRFVLHGPFLLAFNPVFYEQTKNHDFLEKLVEKVPKNAFVMTHNNLAIRFTHQDVRLITIQYTTERPDYIVIDMRLGQSGNNFFGSKEIQAIFRKLLQDREYKIDYQTKDQYIFKKK